MSVLKLYAKSFLAAIWGLADLQAKEMNDVLYHTNLFNLPVIRLGSFKIMLMTITRACVHNIVTNKPF